MSRYRQVLTVVAIAASVLSDATIASAQSSFTPDVSDPAVVDVSFDVMGSTARRDAGGFEWYMPDVTVGLPRGVEIGAAWSSITPLSTAQPSELLPHAKWQMFSSSDGSVTAAVGGAWHVPLSRSAGADDFGVLYAAVGRTFETARPFTLTAGVYTLAGLANRDESRHGVSMSLDQTLTDRWSLSVEWISGTNWYGYLSPGVTYSLGNQWLFAGYCIGNQREANHGPCLSAGRSF